MSLRRIENEIQNRRHLEFILELYNQGLNLEEYQIQELMDAGLIETKKDVELDDIDRIPFEELTKVGGEIKRQKKGNGTYIHSGREVLVKDWMPESNVEHSDEFFKWINSMIYNGFQHMTEYEPFRLYIEQAHNWLSEPGSFDDYDNFDDQWEYFEGEFDQCSVNSLYFLDKYLQIKEPDLDDNENVKYYAKSVHEVICFLFDCKYSTMVGKPRQIAATTTYLGLALKKLMFHKNSFVKFVTMDVDTAEEIMEDKLKYPVSQMPDWLSPSVTGDSQEGLHFARKIAGRKGKRGGANSKFTVVAPSVSAINAGSPSVVMVDEAGYVKVLGKMLRESRPTMFRQAQDGKLQMIRQVIIWSTGGVDDGQNKVKTKSFEEEFTICIEKWRDKDFDYGIIPIFFDWTTRPGITREFYEKEKRVYTVDGPQREQVMNQFRLTYPSRYEDMFLTEAKLLVPISWIQQQEERIVKMGHKFQPTPGFFEPIFDQTIPSSENDDVPFKIIGAKFIETEPTDPRISAYIFMYPEKGWKGRYFKGTDPIMSDNGFSNMASVIFDKNKSTIAAIFDYRDENHKYTFLQCLLFGLFYGTEDEIPELVESNIGTAYTDYIDYKGFDRTLVHRKELPEMLQGGASLYGIDNRASRTRMIIDKMYEFTLFYGENIYFMQLFGQLRTFTCTVNDKGTESWGTQDKKRYHDDLLFAATFAYICSICYDFDPVHYKSDADRYVDMYPIVRDSNGNLTRQRIKKRVA